MTFDEAIAAMREPASEASLCGSRLTVNGVELSITPEQFDIAWDVMDEVYGLGDSVIALPDVGGGTQP